MWRFAGLLVLSICIGMLSGCGQTQSMDSSQPETKSVTEQGENKLESDNAQKANQDQTMSSNKRSSAVKKDKENGLEPDTIKIDSINVESSVDDVGLMDNGEMAVPEDFRVAGWYDRGPMPGERGSSVIAGHVDDKTGPGIFFDLEDLQEGDEVEVTDDNDQKLVFEVVDKQVFPMDQAPIRDIFGYTSRRMLNFVTCTGPFDRAKQGHVDRLVVYTELKTDE